MTWVSYKSNFEKSSLDKYFKIQLYLNEFLKLFTNLMKRVLVTFLENYHTAHWQITWQCHIFNSITYIYIYTHAHIHTIHDFMYFYHNFPLTHLYLIPLQSWEALISFVTACKLFHTSWQLFYSCLSFFQFYYILLQKGYPEQIYVYNTRAHPRFLK